MSEILQIRDNVEIIYKLDNDTCCVAGEIIKIDKTFVAIQYDELIPYTDKVQRKTEIIALSAILRIEIHQGKTEEEIVNQATAINFSKRFPTFESWLKSRTPQQSYYDYRVIYRHKREPQLNLRQLVGHRK